MIVKLDTTFYLDFTVHDPYTGALTDADGTPTAAVYEDNNDTAILTPTVTKRTGHTGTYRVPIAATTANGFESGKSYNAHAAATCNGIDDAIPLATFVVESVNLTDLSGELLRALGLAQENFYMDTVVRDTKRRMTSARIRTYTNAAYVGTATGELATNTITQTYSGSGKDPVTYAAVKV